MFMGHQSSLGLHVHHLGWVSNTLTAVLAAPQKMTDKNTKFEIIKAPPTPLYMSMWKDFYQNTKYTVLKVDLLQDREI